MHGPKLTRRDLTIAAGVAAASVPRVAEARSDEPVRIGFIGVGNRGSQLLGAAVRLPGVKVTALCDVYAPYLERAAKVVGSGTRTVGDFRRVLESRDVDAVVVATPDHWHAVQTIMACDAGKDVYVEKPLSLTVIEGRRMVEAARRNRRIVQVWLQRRSSPMYAALVGIVRSGVLGKVTIAKCFRISNMAPAGIGVSQDAPPPEGLDWDMWLGPSPSRPYNPCIAPYKFRWLKAYSSQIGNWGVHYFDVLRWMLDEVAPASVSEHGGKFAVADMRDIPDTMEAVFEMRSGRLITFGQYEASGVPALEFGEVELRGSNGALYAGGSGYKIIGERGGQFQEPVQRAKDSDNVRTDPDPTSAHLLDFVECVRSRRGPRCDVEEGHRSTVFAHLGNIALATRSRLDWDPTTEHVTNNRRANSMLQVKYRAPWKLE